MNMTNLNSEIGELNIEDLDTVSGGMPFFGMNCSLNQNNALGAVRDLAGSIPIVGEGLAAFITAMGRRVCS
jgi:hypothetical protein